MRNTSVLGRLILGFGALCTVVSLGACGDAATTIEEGPGDSIETTDVVTTISDEGEPIGNPVGDFVAINHAAAKQVVENNLTKHINNLEEALSMLETSGTVEIIADMFNGGDESQESDPSGTPLPEGEDPEPREEETVVVEGLEVDLSGLRDGLIEIIADNIMVEEVSTVSDDGLVLTYALGPDQLCDEEAEEEESEESRDARMASESECAERLANNPLRIDVTSDGAARINISLKVGVDEMEVVNLQIHDDVIATSVQISKIRSLLEAFVDPTDFELPSTMEGVLALEIRETASLAYTARVGLPEAVHIAASGTQDPFGLQIDQSEEVGAISIHGPNKEIAGSLNILGFKVELPWQWIVDIFYSSEGNYEWVCTTDENGEEDCSDMWVDPPEAPEAEGTFSVSLPGISGALAYTLGEDVFRLSSMGLGEETSVVAVDGEPLISIDLNPNDGRAMGLDLMGEGDNDIVFQFSPKLDFQVAFAWQKVSSIIEDMPSFFLDETLAVLFEGSDKPTFKILETEESTLFKVTSGQLTLSSTAMEDDVVIQEGQCFVGVDDEDLSEEEKDAKHDLFGGIMGGTCEGE